MHIHGTPHIHGAHGPNAPHFSHRAQAADGALPTAGTDRVEISEAAQAAMNATETGEIRQDLVNSIRSQIAAGTYDTPAKFDAALERLLDELV
jgi:negative regulator of flagellin synthesis FlgM